LLNIARTDKEYNKVTQQEEITIIFNKDGVEYQVVFAEDYFKDEVNNGI
jgi:hypothetical protein